jgi:hypothetical protein
MAYNPKELEKKALEAIEKNKLFFIDDVIAYLPCSRATFYNLELEKLDTIKDALTKVKTEIKVSMRSKWYKSENPTLQMGLMKLIASPDELKQLAMTHVESNNTHEVKDFNLSDLVKFKDDSPKQ